MLKLIRECGQKNIQVAREGLPQEAQKLLALALKVHEKTNIAAAKTYGPWLERLGEEALQADKSLRQALDFLGDITVSLGRLMTGKVFFRWDDFLL